MQKVKAIKADHLIQVLEAKPMYWQVVGSDERVPYYYLPDSKLYVLVFDVFSYDMQGQVQAQIINAETVQGLYEQYRDIIKVGADYFIKKNATHKL